MSLDSILQQVSKFSGVPAKFGEVSRSVAIGATGFYDGSADYNVQGYQDMANAMQNRLVADEWSISFVHAEQVSNGIQLSVAANVECQYSLDQVRKNFPISVGKAGFFVTSLEVKDVTSCGNPAPIVKTIIRQVPVPVNNTNNNNNNNNQTAPPQPKPKGFLDAFIDPTTQKITAVGIGVVVVVGMVVLTQRR